MGPFVSVQEKKLCPKIFRLLLTVIAPVRGVAGEGRGGCRGKNNEMKLSPVYRYLRQINRWVDHQSSTNK